MFAWNLLIILYILLRAITVTSSFQGSDFLLAFPSSFSTDASFQQHLSIANSGDVNATVNVTLVKNSTVLLFRQVTVGVGQGCFSDCINESLSSNSSRLGGVVVRISSSGRIVVIAHSISSGSDYDNFLAVPTANLSQAYFALAECPSGFCLLIVASASTKVNVTISLCLTTKNKTTPASLTINNTTYHHGSSMTVSLNSWDTLEIVTDGVNLSGSLIQSTGKVAVFSGTLTLTSNTISDFNIEEVVPNNLLGTEYVVVDCPTPGVATEVKIVYTQSNTTLNIDASDLTLKSKRDCIEYYALKQHGAAIIRSDKPVLVQLMYTSDNLVMTPTQNWGTYYITVPSSPSKVLLITRSNCSSGFRFNGVLDNSLSWTSIGDGSFHFADKTLSDYGTWINISVVNCTFSGIVLSPSKSSMLWSLGWGPDFVSQTLASTTTTALPFLKIRESSTVAQSSTTTAARISTSTITTTDSNKAPATSPTTETVSTSSTTSTTHKSPSTSRTAETSAASSTTPTTQTSPSTRSPTIETILTSSATSTTKTSLTISPISVKLVTSLTRSITQASLTISPATVTSSTSLIPSTTQTLDQEVIASESLALTPSSGKTQSRNATIPISAAFISFGVVCPCTCSYASKKHFFYQQKDAVSRYIVDHLKLIAKDQLAQTRLKLSMENHSLSENCLGGTTFVSCIGLVIIFLCAADIVKMASRFKELLYNHSKNVSSELVKEYK